MIFDCDCSIMAISYICKNNINIETLIVTVKDKLEMQLVSDMLKTIFKGY